MTDFDRLLADYLAAAREQAATMRALAGNVTARETPEALALLRTTSHRLRGSGLSFGFPDITRVAGSIEDLVIAVQAGGPYPAAPIAALCEELGGAVADASGQVAAAWTAPAAPARDEHAA